jgi:nucleoside-diphosphate-sugar epimerase
MLMAPRADKPRLCAITGGNGYVGAKIAATLQDNGWTIREFRHAVGTLVENQKTVVPYSLGSEISPASFSDVTAFVHCAYDFRPTTWGDIHAVNVLGSIKLLRAAHTAGVQKIIFISTMSAFTGCQSLYGRAKLEAEKEALQINSIVIRPGLVFGSHSGGVLGALNKVVTRSKFVPLIGNGTQRLYLAHQEDLSLLVSRACEGEVPPFAQPIIAASENGMTLQEILLTLGVARQKKLVFIPLPWRLVWFGLRCSEVIGLPIGFRSDSLISLLNQNPNPDFAPTVQSGIRFRDFTAETLAVAVNRSRYASR